jgi:uncharacterized protein (TIGR03437 family)
LSIPVRLTVSGSTAAAGTLDVFPLSVELAGVSGITNPTQNLVIKINEGVAAHNITATASSIGGWLKVDPFSATTPVTLTIAANSSAVSGPGDHEGSIVITSLLTGEQVTIPVKFTVSLQAIVAEPASLTFTQTRRGVPVASETIQLKANAPSSFSIADVPDWLRVSPLQGATPATLTVWVPVAVLPPGTTSGRIRIIGSNNELTVPVSLIVPQPPGPTATPDAVTFTHQLGGPAPPSQSINVGSTGEAVSFTAMAATDSGVNWLAVTPASGSTPATIKASVDTALLVPGRHSGTIRLAAADGSGERAIPVTLNVSASTISVQGLLHGATFSPTPVAPGQIVTLTGSGLGPAVGVSARPSAAGAIESRLSDVRVLFDGVPAPLLFVRTDQINAIVPYALYGRFSSRIQVEMGTSFSIPIELKVVDAAPGIFTTNGSGRGQAAVLNQDFTPNSLANPALRGSIVEVFGTGEGQTDPPGQDGRIIATDLRRPLSPVTATIGGRPAEITYIGSAPGLVSGVFQANLRIPLDVDTGSIPIEIKVGETATQSGITIAVR